MKLNELLQKREFIIFMNIARIVTLIGVFILIYIMFKNIEIVKLLGSDVCKICMNKTGCFCSCLN